MPCLCFLVSVIRTHQINNLMGENIDMKSRQDLLVLPAVSSIEEAVSELEASINLTKARFREVEFSIVKNDVKILQQDQPRLNSFGVLLEISA